jgi:hypothetical protein
MAAGKAVKVFAIVYILGVITGSFLGRDAIKGL